MKLSSKGRYAVMALADLAKFDPNEPVSLRDISLRQGISLVYLEQLFLRLKKIILLTVSVELKVDTFFLKKLRVLKFRIFCLQSMKKLKL